MVYLGTIITLAMNIGIPLRIAVVGGLLISLIVWEITRDSVFGQSKLLSICLRIIIPPLLIAFSVMMVIG